VSGLRAQTLLRVSYSRLAASHRLEAWIDLVALAAQRPETAWHAAVVGRGVGRSIAVSRLRGPTAERAHEILLDLVRIRDLGLRAPLPLPVKTTEAYAFQRWKHRPPPFALSKAASEWTSSFGYDKEDRAAEHLRVWGRVLPLAELVRLQAAEPVPPYADESSDFGRLACRLWWDLFEHEELL
jgi:exodeoxyribonuclease V gamma subunit